MRWRCLLVCSASRLTRHGNAGQTIALAALVVSASCYQASDAAADANLRVAHTRWTRSGVQDYSVVVQYLCFLRAQSICPYTRPVHFTVRGKVVSRVDAETEQPVPQAGSRITDIEGLFDLVRQAIDRHAYRIAVSYDATYGYPKLIEIDYLENGIDDELQIKVSSFQPAR